MPFLFSLKDFADLTAGKQVSTVGMRNLKSVVCQEKLTNLKTKCRDGRFKENKKCQSKKTRKGGNKAQ